MVIRFFSVKIYETGLLEAFLMVVGGGWGEEREEAKYG